MRNATNANNDNLISAIESARKGAAKIDILTARQKAAHDPFYGVVPSPQHGPWTKPNRNRSAVVSGGVKNNKHCDSNKISHNKKK